MTQFSKFSLLPSIQKALDSLGFTTPTAIQSEVIPSLLAEPTRDIYAQAQTGTGKTLAFGIPLLQVINPNSRHVQALILAPTRELVLQICESLMKVAVGSGIRIEAVYGGMPIQKQIQMIRSGAHIVVGTPGRINDHLRRKTLPLENLKTFVLDEADIMLDMGFKEEIDIMLKHAPTDCPIWLFSATFKPAIKQIITSYMENPLAVRVAQQDVIATHVGQYYCVTAPRQRVAATVRFIEADPEFYGIIFCQTKAQAAEVKDELVQYGFKADCLHGDMSQTLRNKVIKSFKKKSFTILVATDVAARGIDVSDLTHVINLSIPREFDSYVHRIGRTGRAGKEGTAILFVSPSERSKLKQLERVTHAQLQEIKVPSAQDLMSLTIKNVATYLDELTVSATSSDDVTQKVQQLLESYSKDQLNNALIAIIKKTFFKKYSDTNFNTSFSSSSESAGTPTQEVCVDLGRLDGISEDMMREYLEDVCSIESNDIRKLRVIDKKTFIEVTPTLLNKCFDMLKKEPISERKHKVYLLEDTYKDTSRSQGGRRSFGGGNSGGGYSRRPSYGNSESSSYDNRRNMRSRRK